MAVPTVKEAALQLLRHRHAAPVGVLIGTFLLLMGLWVVAAVSVRTGERPRPVFASSPPPTKTVPVTSPSPPTSPGDQLDARTRDDLRDLRETVAFLVREDRKVKTVLADLKREEEGKIRTKYPGEDNILALAARADVRDEVTRRKGLWNMKMIESITAVGVRAFRIQQQSGDNAFVREEVQRVLGMFKERENTPWGF